MLIRLSLPSGTKNSGRLHFSFENVWLLECNEAGSDDHQVKDLADGVYRKHGFDKDFQAPADPDGIYAFMRQGALRLRQ